MSTPASTGTGCDRLSVRSLAYIGDAVYELHARERTLRLTAALGQAGTKVQGLHKATVAHVSASGQAELARRLLPHLTEQELGLFKRARNHKGAGRSDHAYRMSTALEAVLGYLHLSGDFQRLNTLLTLTDTFLEEKANAAETPQQAP